MMYSFLRSSTLAVALFFLCIQVVVAQSALPTEEQQIMAAVSAAPESLQAEATVLGYQTASDSTLSVLRKGTNKLICIADDPKSTDFHVACYHQDLEPFMKRGRQLKAKGMSRKEIDLIRRSEIRSGKIPMPERAMALYALSGPDDAVDYEERAIDDVSPLYVVYLPNATAESTGLPLRPFSKGAPWLMEPGTPWAHIMISTGEKVNKKVPAP
ncbi:hypothetical protein [Fodinibius sediminis]|uniref:Uncharacterized protein n=1 Tax=Fodinibius sediminis TaxID=1214077 RepID=A0A521APN7_9BACT|nr:hypothetical protein [Fodinibius sediminis]SMO36794.1 hypothetical protein SAMN06265218_101263 [Fodinibius sediminis]